MKKVTSEQLLVGKTYYANNDRTTPLTFVKYDELGDPCFKQGGSKGYLESNGLASFFKPMTFIEAEQQPDLTLQEKFEQGWSMVHRYGATVIEMATFKNGKIVVVYSDNDILTWTNEQFNKFHAITPPAPKVERRFTAVGYSMDDELHTSIEDYKTLEDARAGRLPRPTTCILEHEKQGDKWVFVKAHEV